jgi:hypothetical protein
MRFITGMMDKIVGFNESGKTMENKGKRKL